MDASNLLNDLEVYASNGVVFSKEQKAILQNSLTVTKAQYNFSRISFWGKISGLKDDYFIAQGYRKNMANDESSLQTLYSLNAADWCILEEVEKSVRDLALTLRGRFIGDPSFSYDCVDPNAVNNIDNNNTEDNNNNKHGERFGQGDFNELQILEESRLAAVVSEISKVALAHPKHSICKDGSLNLQWNGLDGNQAIDISNWCDGSNGEMASGDCSTYWSIQKQRGLGVDCIHVVLRNLLWLGAIAFHTTETNQFGKIYVGTGEYNIDHSFMI
jgi:radial spoke head protein 9